MSDFDFEQRRQQRLQEKERGAGAQQTESAAASEAQRLSESVSRYYGAKLAGQFEQSTKGATITLTKKGGGTSLTIKVLGKGRFKLSGGTGPGGLGADVGQSMDEVGKDDMMDTVDEWFSIAT